MRVILSVAKHAVSRQKLFTQSRNPVTRIQRYIHLYERYAAALFLIMALALPRVSAVLVEFIPGIDTVVICTGSEYVTITLGPDGKPLDVDESSDNRCTLSEMAGIGLRPQTFWQRLATSFDKAFSVAENQRLADLNLTFQQPSRAPPALI